LARLVKKDSRGDIEARLAYNDDMGDISKKRIIAISGMLGAGKSTTARRLAEELGYGHFSSGDLMRAIGKEHGINDINQVNLENEKDQKFDHLVDGRLRQIGESEDRLVIDSRMAWHWIPRAFKVFLDIPLEYAVSRIMAGISPERRATEHIPDDPQEYQQILQERIDSENRRYDKLYGVDLYSLSQYDLVVDTKDKPLEAVVEEVLLAYREWIAK